jgi:DHA1 family bicyclomycin/chloramphenicol resistance-like MFS transporter
VDQPTETIRESVARTQRLPMRLLILLIAMTAVGSLSLNIMVPAVPKLAVTFAADPNLVQLTISLYLFGYATSQLFLGPLSDRFGRRPVMLAGLALATMASAGAVMATSIGGLIAARVVQSFGASTGLVIGRAIVRDLVDREHAAATIGLVTAAVVIAPLFGPLFGGVLDTAFGWQAIFVFIAALSGMVLIWAIMALPETRPIRAADSGAAHFLTDVRALISSRRFHGYVLASTLTSAPFFVFIGGGPHMVVTLMERTSAEYGMWWGVGSLGYMAGNFTASRLSVKYGIDAMIKWGLWIEFVCCILLAVLTEMFFHLGPAIPFVLLLFAFVGNGLALPNAIAGAISIRPQAAGTASGVSGFFHMSTGAVVAQLTGWALVGASTALPMTAILAVLATAGVIAYYALLGPARPKA